MDFDAAEIIQALGKMLFVGTIKEVQQEPLRYKVQITEKRSSGWLFHGASRAQGDIAFDAYEEGEQVLCASIFKSELGYVLCALFSDSGEQPEGKAGIFHRKFSDGTVFEHNKITNETTLIKPSGELIITAPEKCTFDTAELYCTGDIKADGEITDAHASMSDDRGIYDGHNHPETGSTTQPPTDKQGA